MDLGPHEHDAASVVVSAPHSSSKSRESAQGLLAPLRRRPDTAAVLCDVDGTIAPIVVRPEDASVSPRAREVLADLGSRYKLVACVSGRRAEDVRRLVGIASITYVGNHGLEYLRPGKDSAEIAPEAVSHELAVQEFSTAAYTPRLRELGVRLEDKRSIQSFHWREATDEPSAVGALQEVATAAKRQRLRPHWGRKVLEIRPPVAIDKGTALQELVSRAGVKATLYAGDDTTDLDAFRALRGLAEAGALEHAVCVGVRSDEGPTEIAESADLVADGPQGLIEVLAMLAS